MARRWHWTTIAIVASLLLSVASFVLSYRFGIGTGFLFLFLPFLFFGLRPRNPKACPVCGFQTRHPAYRHCPQDGTPLQ